MRRIVVALVLSLALGACEGCDPYECKAGDVDGDGRCNEA